MTISGQLLSGDTIVAEIINNRVRPVLTERMPLYLARGGDFEEWIISRAVDNSRPNSRILKKMLKLKSVDDASTVLRANAATITDDFWFRQEGEQLTWDTVRFTENRYADLALTGNFLAFKDDGGATRTPELTNIGSFEKAWKLEDGVWYLYKQGDANERFSELVAYRLGKLLGFDMAQYTPAGAFIKSRDFTDGKWNFEPAAAIVGDSVDEVRIYDALQALNPKLVIPYMNIIYLDALVFNVDRHSYNYGFLRDRESGEVVSMAPNFDNNLSLISRGAAGSPQNSSTLLIQDFMKLVTHAPEVYPMPSYIAEEKIRALVMNTLPDEQVDRVFAAELLINRQNKLFEYLQPIQAQPLALQ